MNTKKEFFNLLLKYINPLQTKFVNNNTQLKWGNKKVVYDQSIVGIEGFSRVLWGLSPIFSQPHYEDNKTVKFYWKTITQGLKLATSKKQNKNSWPIPEDRSQIFVELNSIAVFILFNQKQIKKEFTTQEIDDLCEYLATINRCEISSNNWQFFKVLINLALLKLKSPLFDEKQLLKAIRVINSCYIDEGWYFDGNEDQKDYYNAWGYHYYGLLFNFFGKKEYPEAAKVFVERATEFYGSYKYFFNKSGMQIPFGRSLIYRFAASAYFSALALNNIYPEGMAELKWFIVKNLEFFTKQPTIFDQEGKLNLGFMYENHDMLEEYNSNTSPYWALKTFLILELDEEKRFWKTEIKKPKWRKVYPIKSIKAILVNADNDEKYLLNSGQYAHFEPDHNVEKYTKEVYSTARGFSILKNEAYKNLDMQLILSVDDKEYHFKKLPSKVYTNKLKIFSQWECEIAQVKSTTYFDEDENDIVINYEIESPHQELFVNFNTPLLRKIILSSANKILTSSGLTNEKTSVINAHKDTNVLKSESYLISKSGIAVKDEKLQKAIIEFRYKIESI